MCCLTESVIPYIGLKTYNLQEHMHMDHMKHLVQNQPQHCSQTFICEKRVQMNILKNS